MLEQGAQSQAGWQFGTKVLVVVETCRGGPTRQSLDLIAAAAGSGLANHGPIIAVSLHRFSDAVQEMLRSRGCGHLLVPARERVSSIHAPDAWTHFLSMLVPQCERALVLLPHSLLGCEVGARVAFRIGCPVLINCESVTLRSDDVTVSRACFGARLEEEVKIHAPLTVLTVAGNASFSAEAVDVRNCDDNWIVEEVEHELANSPNKIECIRREVESEPPGPSLETANVVVGGVLRGRKDLPICLGLRRSWGVHLVPVGLPVTSPGAQNRGRLVCRVGRFVRIGTSPSASRGQAIIWRAVHG
jgi:electron transfer flavoprotein alpha subunit